MKCGRGSTLLEIPRGISGSRSMVFRTRVPAPPLDAFIQFVWLYEAEPRPLALERVLPTGCAQLIVNLKEDEVRRYEERPAGLCCVSTPGTVLAGVHSRYGIIDTAEQEHVVGVCFKPGGTVPFFRAPASETIDEDVPIEDLWGRQAANALRTRLLEADGVDAKLAVMERALRDAWRPVPPHPAVAFALQAFRDRPLVTTVQSIESALALSPKRFIERFKSEVGLTPKRYCRILRFQRVLGHTRAGARIDWADLALHCGYFDQPHFIHDFRAFAGVTPSAYLAARTEARNHVKFLQAGD